MGDQKPCTSIKTLNEKKHTGERGETAKAGSPAQRLKFNDKLTNNRRVSISLCVGKRQETDFRRAAQ